MPSEYESVLGSHAAYYAGLVEREGPRLHGQGRQDEGQAQLAALRTMQLELENINLALDTALERRAAPWLKQLAAYVYRFLAIKGDATLVHSQYVRLLAAAEEQTDAAGGYALNAHCGLAAALTRLGRLDEARELSAAGLKLAQLHGNRAGEAQCLRNLGLVEQGMGNFTSARALHQESLQVARDAADRFGETAALSNLGLADYGLGDFDSAREQYGLALTNWRSCGDVYGEALTLQNLGNVEAIQGSFDSAVKLFERALNLARKLGNRSGETSALIALGFVDRRQARLEDARDRLTEALAIAHELGDRQLELAALGNLGTVELRLENADAAGTLFRRALTLARELGHTLMTPFLCIPCAATLLDLGRYAEAVTTLHGAVTQLAALDHALDADDQLLVQAVQARIEQAVGTEQLSLSDSEAAQAQGASLTTEQLGEFVMAALQEPD